MGALLGLKLGDTVGVFDEGEGLGCKVGLAVGQYVGSLEGEKEGVKLGGAVAVQTSDEPLPLLVYPAMHTQVVEAWEDDEEKEGQGAHDAALVLSA